MGPSKVDTVNLVAFGRAQWNIVLLNRSELSVGYKMGELIFDSIQVFNCITKVVVGDVEFAGNFITCCH